MLQLGFTVNQAVLTLALISAVLGGIGVLGWYAGISDHVLLIGLIGGPFLLHSWFSLHGWKHLGRPWHWVARVKGIGRAQLSLK
jgi:hypothetical protein